MFCYGKTLGRNHFASQKCLSGFSLLELLLTVTLIAILTAISVSFYSQHLTKAKRLEAETTLSQLSAAMEEWFLQKQTYQSATLAGLGFSEKIAGNRYLLTIATQSAEHFLVSAVPQGQQAKEDLACGTLSLNDQNQKTISGTGKQEECW